MPVECVLGAVGDRQTVRERRVCVPAIRNHHAQFPCRSDPTVQRPTRTRVLWGDKRHDACIGTRKVFGDIHASRVPWNVLGKPCHRLVVDGVVYPVALSQCWKR